MDGWMGGSSAEIRYARRLVCPGIENILCVNRLSVNRLSWASFMEMDSEGFPFFSVSLFPLFFPPSLSHPSHWSCLSSAPTPHLPLKSRRQTAVFFARIPHTFRGLSGGIISVA